MRQSTPMVLEFRTCRAVLIVVTAVQARTETLLIYQLRWRTDGQIGWKPRSAGSVRLNFTASVEFKRILLLSY